MTAFTDTDLTAGVAPAITVISPCYCDSGNISPLVQRLTCVCQDMGCTYEILLVDDGSPDDTWEKIKEHSARDPHIRGILLARNHGHQLAVTAGLLAASGKRVLIIDSDLQDPPELLPEMMAMMDQGFDNIYGQRISRKGVPAWKNACYKIYYKILSALAGCYIPPDTGDFRLISRRVVDVVNKMPEHHRFLRGMISWTGFRQKPIFYHRDARHAGISGYTLAKLFGVAIDGITSFSVKPLRFAVLLGCVFGGFCLFGMIMAVIGYVKGNIAVAGWTSLMVVVLMSSCLQFFVLGLIGEYIGRLFVQAKGRPLCIIAETVHSGVVTPV